MINRRGLIKAFGYSSFAIGAVPLNTYLSGADLPRGPKKDNIRRLLYNENPDGPSPKALDLLKDTLDRSNRYCTFHQYDYNSIKQKIAKEEGLSKENILLGHGSFQPLCWTAIHYSEGSAEILVPSPTFDVVGHFARVMGATVIPVEVDEYAKMPLSAMRDKVSSRTRLITLCNPNNPTGTICDPAELADFCKDVASSCAVLIDEAYIHYVEDWRKHTMAPLVNEGAEVLIARTISKMYGMAGLRVGYLVGPAHIISELEKNFTMGFPGNMPNSLSVAAAHGALDDSDFVKKSREKNKEKRDRLYADLISLGIKYIESQANFVYFDVGDFPKFKSHMNENGVIIAGGWPSMPSWARVTIGSYDDMEYFTSLLTGKSWR